jgi:hypothetical protein
VSSLSNESASSVNEKERSIDTNVKEIITKPENRKMPVGVPTDVKLVSKSSSRLRQNSSHGNVEFSLNEV